MTLKEESTTMDNTDAYWQLDFNHNIERSSDIDNLTIIHDGFTRITHRAMIEKFVRKVLNTKKLAFDVNGDLVFPESNALPNYYRDVDVMLSAYDERYEGTPQVDVFFKACKDLGFLDSGAPFRFRDEKPEWYCGPKRNAEWFNALIERIRKLCGKGWYKKRVRQDERRRLQRLAAAMQWEQRLFDGRFRHLMMFITLQYKPQYRDEVTPEQVQEDLGRLLNNRRSNGLLRGIKEFIWHIEESDKTGLHVHILIAYDGESKRDMSISQSICRYWVNVITQGRGHAHTANLYRNSQKRKQQVDCLGLVCHDDDEKRDALRQRLLTYMAKANQLLKRKTCRFRTFGMSQPPEHSGKGRKRKCVTTLAA